MELAFSIMVLIMMGLAIIITLVFIILMITDRF